MTFGIHDVGHDMSSQTVVSVSMFGGLDSARDAAAQTDTTGCNMVMCEGLGSLQELLVSACGSQEVADMVRFVAAKIPMVPQHVQVLDHEVDHDTVQVVQVSRAPLDAEQQKQLPQVQASLDAEPQCEQLSQVQVSLAPLDAEEQHTLSQVQASFVAEPQGDQWSQVHVRAPLDAEQEQHLWQVQATFVAEPHGDQLLQVQVSRAPVDVEQQQHMSQVQASMDAAPQGDQQLSQVQQRYHHQHGSRLCLSHVLGPAPSGLGLQSREGSPTRFGCHVELEQQQHLSQVQATLDAEPQGEQQSSHGEPHLQHTGVIGGGKQVQDDDDWRCWGSNRRLLGMPPTCPPPLPPQELPGDVVDSLYVCDEVVGSDTVGNAAVDSADVVDEYVSVKAAQVAEQAAPFDAEQQQQLLQVQASLDAEPQGYQLPQVQVSPAPFDAEQQQQLMQVQGSMDAEPQGDQLSQVQASPAPLDAEQQQQLSQVHASLDAEPQGDQFWSQVQVSRAPFDAEQQQQQLSQVQASCDAEPQGDQQLSQVDSQLQHEQKQRHHHQHGSRLCLSHVLGPVPSGLGLQSKEGSPTRFEEPVFASYVGSDHGDNGVLDHGPTAEHELNLASGSSLEGVVTWSWSSSSTCRRFRLHCMRRYFTGTRRRERRSRQPSKHHARIQGEHG